MRGLSKSPVGITKGAVVVEEAVEYTIIGPVDGAEVELADEPQGARRVSAELVVASVCIETTMVYVASFWVITPDGSVTSCEGTGGREVVTKSVVGVVEEVESLEDALICDVEASSPVDDSFVATVVLVDADVEARSELAAEGEDSGLDCACEALLATRIVVLTTGSIVEI